MEVSSMSDVAEDTCAACPGLRRAADSARQELHDARRAYHTALDVQRHLAAELEAALADHARRADEHRHQLAAVRDQLARARADRDAIAARLDAAQDDLARRPADRQRASPPATPDRRTPSPPPPAAPSEPAPEPADAEAEARRAEAAAAAEAARGEARELAARLAALQTASAAARAAAEEREAEWLQSTALLRAQLHARGAGDADPQHAEKGNSLFAEVDDKRQEMAHALLLMKQKNSQLRRSLAEARAETEAARRAGREDLSAHHLQQLTESYAERVSVLEAKLEQARRAAARGAERGGAERGGPERAHSSARELAAALQLWELRRARAAAGS